MAILGAVMLTACDSTTEPDQAQGIPVQTGCYSASYGSSPASAFGCGLLYSSGNPDVDRQSNEEYANLNNFYQLPYQPAMYLFNECSGVKNALSSPQGYILMGYNFLVDTAVRYNTLLPYAGIMAHEWGHQIQFQYGYMPAAQSTARNTELEADAWAGFYVYVAKGWSGNNLESFLQMLFDIGDFHYNHPSHHGTPEERRYMGAYGMEVARDYVQNNRNLTYNDLHQIWLQAINQIGQSSAKSKSDERVSEGDASSHLDLELLQGILSGDRSLSEIQAGNHNPHSANLLHQ